jgi:threonine aldolase
MVIFKKNFRKKMTIKEKICLASDNFTPAHPDIINAVAHSNEGYATPYGADPWTLRAEELIQKTLKSHAKVLIVPTGTGANVLAFKLACRRHESVISTDIAHIQYQEAGASESIVGCKLLSVPHTGGKATPEAILKKLKNERVLGKHSTSPRVLSITQPTEVGTVYTLEELHALSKLCKEEHLLFHMDGSRLYNAAVRLGASLDQITHAASLDILSLGGTKNGLMCAEALVIFNPSLQEGAETMHKQNLLLTSKMRYLSAQYIPFFEKELWRPLATHANEKAQEIAAMIKTIPQLALSYPVETNQIFFTAPVSLIPLIQEKIICYVWDHEKNEIRFIASWNTTEKDVKEIRAILKEIS